MVSEFFFAYVTISPSRSVRCEILCISMKNGEMKQKTGQID